MGPTTCTIVTIAITAAVVAVGVYLGWPSPPLSTRLREWRNRESAYFKYKGRQLFYKDVYGKGVTDPMGTVLLLHGFPTMSFDWIKIWPSMAENFRRVIAVDFLGFGFSDKTIGHNHTIVEQADLVFGLLRALKVDSIHIFSHDYGDSVAQEMLARQNDDESEIQIKSVCLLNGGMFKETNFPQPIQHLLAANPTAGRIISRISNRYIYGTALSKIFGANTKPTEEDLYDFWCGHSHKQGYMLTSDLLAYIAERSWNNLRWRRALQNSQVPVHVIYGPADPVNPPGFIEFYKREVVKGTIDVLAEEIGHYPHWEDSANVTRLYLQFIETKVNTN